MIKTLDNVFMMDNKSYVGLFVTSLKRGCSILDGDNVGRNLNGSMIRDIIGSFLTYEMEIDASGCNKEVYDTFYENVTTTSKESHLCRFVYGQKYIKMQMYVAEVSDELKQCASDGNHWGNLSITFVAMDATAESMKVTS